MSAGRIGDFLEQLDKVEDKLTAPEKDTVDNPLDARVGDKLEGGFVVRGRLGSGSSAVVLLVEKDAKEFVLKLSSQALAQIPFFSKASCVVANYSRNLPDLGGLCRTAGRT